MTSADNAPTLPPAQTPPAVRTCESLGICQHPARECTGTCEQKPRLPAWEPTDPSAPVQGFVVEDLRRDNFVTAVLVAAVCGITLGVIYGAGRWAWQVYS